MSWFGTIGRTALKALHSNKRVVLIQPPNYVSVHSLNMFSKISKELENKVPERPKRPQNGYNSFYKEKAAELRIENPKIKVKEMAKSIGDMWRNLDSNIKQEIMEKSRRNSEEYKQEIEKWRKSLNEEQMQTYFLGIRSRRQMTAKRRLKSELKRLDYPIRPKSAFNLYVKESIDNRERTDEPFIEVFKRVVAKWGTLTPEDKIPYIESAKNDKIRYLQELNDWQENMKTLEQKNTLEKLTKLKSITSKSYLNPDLKKEKTKKVVKKKLKAKKLKGKTKTSQKIKAKPKIKSKSKKAAKPKSKKTSKPKDSKTKKPKKESSGKEDSSDSSE